MEVRRSDIVTPPNMHDMRVSHLSGELWETGKVAPNCVPYLICDINKVSDGLIVAKKGRSTRGIKNIAVEGEGAFQHNVPRESCSEPADRGSTLELDAAIMKQLSQGL